MDFRWTPNTPLDPRIPERMLAAFPIPSELPPVAWFMSKEQEYFDSLADEIAAKDEQALEEYLFDTGGGIKNFGRLDIWVQWYRYMLPTVIEMCFAQADLAQLAMGYIFNAYPDGIPKEYPGFREDVLGSLGKVVMSAIWWASPDILNDLNSSMFFCLKYLHADEIAGWVDSIAAIDTPEWREVIRQWLNAFQTMQHLLDHPEEVEAFRRLPPDELYQPKDLGTADHLLYVTNLSWDESFLVFGSRPAAMLETFFPPDNLAAFWDAVNRHDWLREAVSGNPE